MTNPEQFGEDGPGRDLADEGIDTTLGDQSTHGRAAEQVPGRRRDDESGAAPTG